jgi:hypothetical protein
MHSKHKDAHFEVRAAVWSRIPALWDVTMRDSVSDYRLNTEDEGHTFLR